MMGLARKGIVLDKGTDVGGTHIDSAIPNMKELTRRAIGMLYIGDIIGYVPDYAQDILEF